MAQGDYDDTVSIRFASTFQTPNDGAVRDRGSWPLSQMGQGIGRRIVNGSELGLTISTTRPRGRAAVQSQPRSRASRAAAVRLGAPSLRMASDR